MPLAPNNFLLTELVGMNLYDLLDLINAAAERLKDLQGQG